MDGKIDTVREALIKLRSFAKSLDCDYQEECTPGDDDMCQVCRHVYIADSAIAALSAIDPDATRAEARAEALREAADRSELFVRNLLRHATLPEDLYQDLRAAILADEPKEHEAEEPQIGDVVACRSQDHAGYLAHRWPGGLAPECYVVLMRRAEVERKLKEAEPADREGLLYKSDVDDRGEG